MRKACIPVVHYVSPSVWAWRSKRVFKMEKFIDCLLTLFPFEAQLYKDTRIQAKFVGHPLAKKIPIEVDKNQIKAQLNCTGKKIFAVLPGSRNREIQKLMPIFCQTIQAMKLQDQWQIASSNVNQQKIALVQSIAESYGINILWQEDTTDLLMAADFALLGSGTVALEAMLCKTPMVVSYQISAMTWFIVKTFNMMQLPYYSLPNVLHGGFLVPEVMQNDLTVNNLKAACLKVMEQPAQQNIDVFTQIHQSLVPEFSDQAARAVMQFRNDT